MTSPVTWLPDGRPRSDSFDDIYRSAGVGAAGGWAQARQVFLGGCGLLGGCADGTGPDADSNWADAGGTWPSNAPPLWAHARRWTVLENGLGLGLNFLATWHAWRQARQAGLAPQVLHYVGVEAQPPNADDVLRSAAAFAAEAPGLLQLAQQLAQHWQGLLPGFHRIALEDGALQLTLCVGDAKAMLRELRLVADSVFLDGFDPAHNPDMWDPHTLKAISHLCRRGTRIATWCVARPVRDALAQCGFDVQKAPGLPPKRHRLQGQWAPRWQPRFATAAPLWAHLAPPPDAPPCLDAATAQAASAIPETTKTIAESLENTCRSTLFDPSEKDESSIPATPLPPHLAPPPDAPPCLDAATAQAASNIPETTKTIAENPENTCRRTLFNPSKKNHSPRTALVIGSGLAGASAAYSLAQRGWRVTVLEAGAAPASGASALPVGLVAPHVSPDDRALSQLTRAGLAATLARARALLREGQDWAPSGVLERRIQKSRELPPDWANPDHPGHAWSHPASAAQLAQAGLVAADGTTATPIAPTPIAFTSTALTGPPSPTGPTPSAAPAAHWHPRAAWVRPAALVQAMLKHPGITWRSHSPVARLVAQADGSNQAALPANTSAAAAASNAIHSIAETLENTCRSPVFEASENGSNNNPAVPPIAQAAGSGHAALPASTPAAAAASNAIHSIAETPENTCRSPVFNPPEPSPKNSPATPCPTPCPTPLLWRALDAQGQPLAEAGLVVVAAGYPSRALLQQAVAEALPASLSCTAPRGAAGTSKEPDEGTPVRRPAQNNASPNPPLQNPSQQNPTASDATPPNNTPQKNATPLHAAFTHAARPTSCARPSRHTKVLPSHSPHDQPPHDQPPPAAPPPALPINPLRGQITWGFIPPALRPGGAQAATLPPFPVNGLGNFISGPALDGQPAWILGSSFDRGCDQPVIQPEDAPANFDKLAQLLPQAAAALRPQLEAGQTHAWAAVRCTVPDRVPIAGAVDAQRLPGLMACTAMGARGMTLAVLCGELLAAQLDAEPLPVPARLAHLLRVGRFG